MTGLGFSSKAPIGLLHAMEGDRDTETSLPDRSFTIICMKLREGTGDGEAGYPKPHDRCPQELCMACG